MVFTDVKKQPNPRYFELGGKPYYYTWEQIVVGDFTADH